MSKLSNWIPIFKTGTHTDGAGEARTYGPAELDQMVAKFQPALHEPPVVIGHPKTDSPAWGWVAGLKREGELLLAQFKDLAPEFMEMVRDGRFKKRSIAHYEDLMLRHVGFLGAAPPGVKGLPDVAFAAGAFAEVETDHITEEETMEKGTFMEWLKEGLTGLGLIKSPADKQAAEFAEKERALADREAALKEKEGVIANASAAAAAAAHTAEVGTFCDGLKAKGHLLPAWEKLGLRQFLAELPHDRAAALTFAEGGEKVTPYTFMTRFLEALPQTVTFAEVAGADKKTPNAATDAKTWAAAEFDRNKDTYTQLGTTVEMLEKIAPVKQ